MLLVVLLLVISLGVNVLLGLRVIKLSNKSNYWRKQYETNKECKAYESIQKSQSILEEAFNELGTWYSQVQKDLDNVQEDYEVLAEQYADINGSLEYICNNYGDMDDLFYTRYFLEERGLRHECDLFIVNGIRASNCDDSITMEQFEELGFNINDAIMYGVEDM